jgi:hypothetical protein
MADQFCFQTKDLSVYVTLLVLVVVFVAYVLYKKSQENMSNVNLTYHMSQSELQQKIMTLQDELHNTKIAEQSCRSELAQAKDNSVDMQTKLLNKIYNPLSPPERVYPGGRLGVSGYQGFQMIGFLFNNNERYPLYGRYKYPGRTNKFEYYLIDESRNRLKIPFKSRNDDELSDGDSVYVPEVGENLSVRMYEYENFRYNPNFF